MIRYSLDLELEQPRTNPQTPDSELDAPKIIQIGVVFFNSKTEETLEHKTWYINAGIKLSKFIKELTGITQEDLDNGVSINQAYEELLDLIKKYECFRQPITWGGGDLKALQDEVGRYTLGRNEMNVKTLYQAWAPLAGHKYRVGLEKACNIVGIGFKGKAHDATVDAHNTARIFNYFMRKLV